MKICSQSKYLAQSRPMSKNQNIWADLLGGDQALLRKSQPAQPREKQRTHTEPPALQSRIRLAKLCADSSLPTKEFHPIIGLGTGANCKFIRGSCAHSVLVSWMQKELNQYQNRARTSSLRSSTMFMRCKWRRIKIGRTVHRSIS